VISSTLVESPVPVQNRDDERTSVALDMLADNKPIEEIVRYSHLPMEKVLELRDSQATFDAKK
jgi:hypothetical protein